MEMTFPSVEIMWKPQTWCSVHVEIMWCQHGNYMVSIWEQHCVHIWNHVVLTWKPHDVHVETMEMTWKQQKNPKFVVSRLISSSNPGKPWKPFGFHVWKWCGNNIVCILWCPTHRKNMTNFKLHSKQVMETMCFPCGHHLGCMWNHVVSMLTQHGYNVDTTRFPGGHHMVSM